MAQAMEKYGSKDEISQTRNNIEGMKLIKVKPINPQVMLKRRSLLRG